MNTAELAFDLAHQASPQAEVFIRLNDGSEVPVGEVKVELSPHRVVLTLGAVVQEEPDLSEYLDSL